MGEPPGFSGVLAKEAKNRLDFEIGTAFGAAFSGGSRGFRRPLTDPIKLSMALEGARRWHAGYFSRSR